VIAHAPIGVFCCAFTVSVEAPCPPGDRVTDELLRDFLGPEVGETTFESVTVPANPLRLVSVIKLAPEVPRGRLSDDGLMEIEKSDTTTVTETERTSRPLVPVIVPDRPHQP